MCSVAQAIKDGHVGFLICTDVAALPVGIDIKALPYMINVTLPDEAQQYIHRTGNRAGDMVEGVLQLKVDLPALHPDTGREGRAGKMGLDVSLVATAKENV